MKMSFPDPSENHQPYTKNSVKIIWIYIFVHFRQPCNAHRAERKEEGSVLPVFEQYFLFSRAAFINSNYSLHYDEVMMVPRTMCPETKISLGHCAPLDNASLGRYVVC
jgi:hypothetical protein